ncbi:MAG TPA: DUF2961 domain-containing protein, partial [Candidatus Saccharimonadales bacterium]|nr:DUF2961 domain-containing protein [Candidatus Saccharimonadales bacterium]
RKGGNEGADASHFLEQLADDRNVTLDVAGAGILYFARYNHWHGSPWHYVVDGRDWVVQESSSSDPTHPADHAVFLPENLFPPPLAVTWADTKGADLSWVPIYFTNSFRMDYTRTHYGTGYYIYQQYVGGARLSHPLASWNGEAEPAHDVLNLIAHAGTDLAPRENVTRNDGVLSRLEQDQTNLVLVLNSPGMIRKMSFSIPLNQALAFGRARLRVTWDGRKDPSIDAPLALFFGAGTLYNREQRPFLVRAFPMNIRYGTTNVELSCYFPMPFFKSAKVELIGPARESVTNVEWHIVEQQFQEPASSVGYFHATYRDHARPIPGQDLVLLDTRQVEGGGDWSGSFVGNSWIFSDRANLTTLEGDPRFFFDDSQTPQAQGTGTEEWGGGGDYWGGVDMTLPFAGHPTGAAKIAMAQNPEDQIESAYRFLLGDLMPFGKNALICLEHGGEDQSTEHYQTVTYWYGAPAPSLIKTDELKVGDLASEAAHQYQSPKASDPYVITSRYEWGVDTLHGQEIYPASSDRGRKTTGASEFTLKLNPENLGVLLRRKLDYVFPNQRAEVFVADGSAAASEAVWKPAGTWFLAGANTCVYSNPKGEMGATQHVVETSNRRFRDDEFLIGRPLTQGRSSIRVRVKFVAVNLPLFPGRPVDEQAWSEMRYDAYCFVLPAWNPLGSQE